MAEAFRKRFVRALEEHPEGLSQEKLQELPGFGDVDPEHLSHAINVLSRECRIDIITSNPYNLYYRIVDEDVATKLCSLETEERAVYRSIVDGGKQGAFTRSIRANTNLAANSVNRTIKKLMVRKLIKYETDVKVCTCISYS